MLLLQVFPILFKDLCDFDTSTRHRKIVNSSTEIERKSYRFFLYYQRGLSLLHIFPIDLTEFDRFGGGSLSKEFNISIKNLII